MSTRLRALLVDDERLARQLLAEGLANAHAHEIEIVGEAKNVTDAAAMALALRPEAIFLDVQMPPESGFALLPFLSNLQPRPWIIFTTAFDEYAVQAFETDALDYLLKPYTAERLSTSIQRLKAERLKITGSEDTQPASLPDLGGSVAGGPLLRHYARKELITLKDGRSRLIIRAEEICAIQAIGPYTQILIENDKKIMVKISITQWANSLPAPLFKRLSRSLVINQEAVASLTAKNRESIEVTFRNFSTPILLSRLENERLRN